MSIGSDIFLRLIKMIIAPLVLATVVSGIISLREGGSIGRIAGKAMLWFVSASILSLGLGMLFANIFAPGAGLDLAPHTAADTSALPAAAPSARDFIVHIFPASIFEAMATNEVLQILVFAVFLGLALNSLGEQSTRTISSVIAEASDVMLRVTALVMRFAPLGVFCAIAAVITAQGPSVLMTYGRFIATFYASLGVLWLLLMAVGAIILGPAIVRLLRLLREPLLIAFSTSSSEAAFPKMIEQMRAFGVRDRVTSFVLPLGYSFNLDGSMMYQAFAALFIAQAYGVDMSVGEQLTMLLLMMVMSKGIAGVPRASLVVVAAALPMFDLPVEGLLLILGIDQILDMGRTATNVVGNGIATAVVAKWEGELAGPQASGE